LSTGRKQALKGQSTEEKQKELTKYIKTPELRKIYCLTEAQIKKIPYQIKYGKRLYAREAVASCLDIDFIDSKTGNKKMF